MRVYGEAFFLMNGWMDYLCLMLTASLGRRRFRPGRALLAAGLGAGYALIAWMGGAWLRGVPALAAAALGMTSIAFGRGGLRLWPLTGAAGRLEGKKQDDAASTHYPRRRPSDGVFDFRDKPAQEIYNHIRGQARPYPGAFFLKGKGENAKKVYVWKARMGGGLLPGEYAVPCGDGKTVILQRVQEEGRTEVWADEYFAEAGKPE